MIPYADLQSQYRAIKPEIDAAVLSVLDNSQFILGEEVFAFEREFAAYCGAADTVALNSGTSALHLALLASGIGPGDEVITVQLRERRPAPAAPDGPSIPTRPRAA